MLFCTRVVSCYTRVVSCCTHVVSCCTRAMLCCTRVVLRRVVSCCYSCSFLEQIVSLCEINCIKIQKSVSLRDSFCFIYFDVIIHQRLKKNSTWLNFFFSNANEIESCGLVQKLILRMLRDLILQQRDFQSLNEDPP